MLVLGAWLGVGAVVTGRQRALVTTVLAVMAASNPRPFVEAMAESDWIHTSARIVTVEDIRRALGTDPEPAKSNLATQCEEQVKELMSKVRDRVPESASTASETPPEVQTWDYAVLNLEQVPQKSRTHSISPARKAERP